MSELSDYKKHVWDPQEASYKATIETLRGRNTTLTADLTAARAEVERLREALRVFANIPHEEARFELHGEHAAAIPPSLANGAREGSL